MFRRDKKESYIRVILKAGAWKRVPLKLLRWGRKMPSTAQYDLVPNDEYDMRIPLHPDQAFKYGITFHAKYIGTMDVPRPTSRVEIVAAMRRVRYEFKARKVKKRKVTMDISTDGVRVTSRRSKLKSKLFQAARFFTRKKGSAECIEIMHHPIYRIFYVSHDSSDLKIFSYIARDGATNVFKCNVFKSNKKSQAMRIVRTVGQAFEVCHKMNINSPSHPAPSTSSAAGEPVPSSSDAAASKAPASDCGASESGGASSSKPPAEEALQPAKPTHVELLPPPPRKENSRRLQNPVVPTINLPDLPDLSADLPECVTKIDLSVPDGDSSALSTQHQVKLLREKLEQQAQQTRAAVAQLLLLRNQLAVEQTARCEAQARTHQLLVHNRELIDHIAALIGHLHDGEMESPRPINAQQLTMLPQTDVGGKKENKIEANGNLPNADNEDLITFFTADNNNITTTKSQSVENAINNNTVKTSTTMNDIPTITTNGPSSTLNFSGMSNEEIQEYLIAKFQDMGVNGPEPDPNTHKQFYQNTNAFPNIAPLTNHYSSNDLASLLNHKVYQDKFDSTEILISGTQRMSIGQSQVSLCSSDSSSDSSNDNSSEDGVPYIMPLSHNATLTAKGDDGRIRLIVPVSPSESTSDVLDEPQPSTSKASNDNTLRVPEQSVASATAITRTTSEKVPNRSELMSALRAQWTRHTTK